MSWQSSSSSSSWSSSSPPRCKKPKRAIDCKDMVAAVRHALDQCSDSFVLANLRCLLSFLQSSVAASPALALCSAGFLELLPPLLSHSCFKINKKSAEAVGLLAIASYEISCRVAEKQEVLSALVQLLERPKVDVLVIAIASILNVATSDVGCAALQQVAGLPQQLLGLVSVLADKLTESVKAADAEEFGNGSSDAIASSGHQKGDLRNLSSDEAAEVFDLSLAAVNTVFLQDFRSASSKTKTDALLSLRRLWQIITPQFDGVSHNRRAQLAKLIMRLAMQDSSSTINGSRLFGSMEHFLQKHWEQSPTQIPIGCGLSRFTERFTAGGPTSTIELLVNALVACPPAAADELDPWVLYKDMEHQLGLGPVLNQDIRLLKCKAGAEIPYSLVTSTTVSSKDCLEAYASGNTVVIRGLQFRFPEIAAISNGLAAELGQVTVGANLYLTPPESQGLGVHFDDHCVFVCQLRGRKRWSVYPPLEPLPRLYSFKKLATDVKKECVTHYDLHEGDLLYIPRGFLHEACTFHSDGNSLSSRNDCCCDESPTSSNTTEWHGASLHVSFGVEVEPAFEWEGLLHIALRLWSLRQQPSNMKEVCETLLHVAIRNVGSSSMHFRKAYIPSKNAESMFRCMLDEVRESVDCLRRAINWYREGGLAWLDWARHLPGGGPPCEDLYAALESFSDEVLDTVFQSVRDRFCREASFLESIAAQEALLCKFRRSRQKVMNGLLALHCAA